MAAPILSILGLSIGKRPADIDFLLSTPKYMMSQTTVPMSLGAKSYTGGKEQQTIRKCIASKSDKLADFIRRFGSEMIQHCKNEYKVDIFLSENNVLLAGLNSSDIESCEEYVKLYVKERRLFVQISSQIFPLTEEEIRFVTDGGKCVLAMHSLESAIIPDTNSHRWLDPYGSLEFRVNETGGDVKTEILILLTDDKFNSLCCTDDIIRFWNPKIVHSAKLGSAYSHTLDETMMLDSFRCIEVWTIVCTHTDRTGCIDIINNGYLRKAFQKILEHAIKMRFAEICVLASVKDEVKSEIKIRDIVQMLVMATIPLNRRPTQRVSVEVNVKKQDIEEAKDAIDLEFRESYKVYEKFPKSNSSKGKSILIIPKGEISRMQYGKCGSAIKDATGEEIVEECRNRYPNGIPECSVVYTGSYTLEKLNKVKYIFHTALPKYAMCSETKVKEVVKKCLYLAEQLDCTSIAIPALGVGGLGYPRRESAFYTYEAIKEYGMENLQTNLSKIIIVLSSGDEATCKAFGNEEFRRRPKCPLIPSTPFSNGAPILRRSLEQRPQTCARIMLSKAATCPAYAVKIKFSAGTSSIKIIDARKTAWNDSIKLPIEIGTDVQKELAIQLYEERITHLIWNLETKSNIPTLHLISKIMTLLEDMAGSEHLKYIRIVDLVVNESKFDRLKAELNNWELTYETEAPTNFLEVIAESRESLKSVQMIVSSILHEKRLIQATGQTSGMSTKASASSTDVLRHGPSTIDSNNSSNKQTLQANLNSPSTENISGAKYDPTYDKIDDSNESSANAQSTERSNEDDNEHTYETIADGRFLTSYTVQPHVSAQNIITQDSIAKCKTPLPEAHVVSVEKSTSWTPPRNNQASIFEVSAYINTGIIDYLAEHDLLDEWISTVKTKYNVEICRNETVYSVSGNLEDIVQFEHYLETGLNDFKVEEDYFSRDDSLKVPMNEMNYHYISILRYNNLISSPVSSIKYATGVLEAKGLQINLHNLKYEIDKFLALAEQETVTFNTDEEAKLELEKHINIFADLHLTRNGNTIHVVGSPGNVAKAFDSLVPMPKLNFIFEVPVPRLQFAVLQGDIRNSVAGFIAVSSTAKMSTQLGACGSICNMLGENYIQECRLSIMKDREILRGECRVIKSGLCVRRWIGNVVVPTYTRQTRQTIQCLEEAYLKCFTAADDRKCETMAMTCIGSDKSRGGFL